MLAGSDRCCAGGSVRCRATSGYRRCLVAFCFGALLEALAGFGAPVAVTAFLLVGVGFRRGRRARPARQHGAGRVRLDRVPITTLGRITGLDPEALGAMVGRQTPILALFVPLILVLMVDGRRGVRRAWPAALVGGAAFAVAQFVASNYLAYETADIVAAFAGALVVLLLGVAASRGPRDRRAAPPPPPARPRRLAASVGCRRRSARAGAPAPIVDEETPAALAEPRLGHRTVTATRDPAGLRPLPDRRRALHPRLVRPG